MAASVWIHHPDGAGDIVFRSSDGRPEDRQAPAVRAPSCADTFGYGLGLPLTNPEPVYHPQLFTLAFSWRARVNDLAVDFSGQQVQFLALFDVGELLVGACPGGLRQYDGKHKDNGYQSILYKK